MTQLEAAVMRHTITAICAFIASSNRSCEFPEHFPLNLIAMFLPLLALLAVAEGAVTLTDSNRELDALPGISSSFNGG